MCQVVKYLCSAFFPFFFLVVCFGGRVRSVDADFDKPPLILITKKGSKVSSTHTLVPWKLIQCYIMYVFSCFHALHHPVSLIQALRVV